MGYKQETIATYDRLAKEYAAKFQEHTNLYVETHLLDFIYLLPQNAKILELGCGPGMHAALMRVAGHDVECIDLSEEMIAICKANGLNASVEDFEEMEREPESYDAVWAYTCLLHTTRDRLPDILRKINSWLKPNGHFGLAMKEGSGEEFKVSDKDETCRRYFTYYTNDELRELLWAAGFEIIDLSLTNTDSGIFLNYLARKVTI